MKVNALLTGICAITLIPSVFPISASAQTAPGAFADANHPAGAPDPEKLDAIWSVDPVNEQVSITIPFPTTPQGGRGPKLPFVLLYNSGSTLTLQSTASVGLGNGAQTSVFSWLAHPVGWIGSVNAPTGPWTTSGPYFYSSFSNVPDMGFTDTNGNYHKTGNGCTITGPYNFVDQQGGSHDMNLLAFSTIGGYDANLGWAPTCQAAQSGSATYWPTSMTSDGSAMATSNGSVRDRDGISGVGHQLTDTNLNSASFSTSNGLTTATDALGRTLYTTTIPIAMAGQIPAGTYYVTTFSATGTAETYKVIFSSIAIGAGITMPHPTTSEFNSAAYCTTCNSYYTVNQPSAGDTLTAVTEIDLPDTVSHYLFSYDQLYGTISQITFPTGGHVAFTWNIRDKDWSPYGQFQAISALVVTDVHVSDGSSDNHWTYTMESLSPTTPTPIGQVYAPDSSRTDYTGTCLVYTAVPFYAYQAKASCKENSRASYSASGTLLSSGAETFTSHGLPIQVVTSTYYGSTALQRQTVNYYDSYDNVTEKDESDYYSCTPGSNGICPVPLQTTGPWLRRTFTTFSSGLAAVDLPTQVVVTDLNGSPYSLVNYSYDSNGNLQLDKKCLSISGTGASSTCASGSAPWQTQYTYDSHGQVCTKVEAYQALGTSVPESVTYTWGDATGGNPSSNCDTSSANYLIAVSHPNGASDLYTYSPYTGAVESHTDWNTNQSTYSYVDPSSGTPDPLNRIRTITAPKTTDGTPGASGQSSGVTTYTYTDTPGAFSIQEQHKINSLGTITSTTTYFDGLGRTLTTKTVTPQCSTPIEADTVYDSMGRVYTVSNPYCTTSDSTYGLTTFTYDGLGRKIQIKTPDNAISTITYGANATEFTDPPNGTTTPQHIQQVDGLGRLLKVCEISASTFGGSSPSSCGLNVSGSGYLTSYTYDPQGNLLTVNQQGVSRSYVYDKLSRLTNATNPETGAVSYVYSTPTNACSSNPLVPCSKTDARSVTVSYGYDNLSRLLSKTYSSNGGSTPLSCYQYDTSSVTGAGGNLIGHLTNAWTQPASSGSCTPPPTSFINLKSILMYDAVGRPLIAQQQTCIGGTCSGPTPFKLTASYDLAGNVTTLTNSVGANNQPLTLTNYFDSASRPCLTTSSWTAPSSPNIFQINPAASSTSPGYSSAGGMQNYFLGSTASTAATSCATSPASPVNVVLGYTKRFWVSSIAATGQIP